MAYSALRAPVVLTFCASAASRRSICR